MGAVDTTYTFTATDTITSTKMNNIIDQTTITPDAIIGNTLEVATGKLKVRAAGITSNELAIGSVTSNAILDGTIVNADINATADISGSKLANNSTSGLKITDATITAQKLDGAQTGSAPIFGVRAWARFNGASSTPITPDSSGNISSIVRTATGKWTVTLTTAISNANYCVLVNSKHATGVSTITNIWPHTFTTTTFNLEVQRDGGVNYNSDYISFVVLG